MVRDELGRNALNDLGDTMGAAKGVAPTHPHPRSPDTPPANVGPRDSRDGQVLNREEGPATSARRSARRTAETARS